MSGTIRTITVGCGAPHPLDEATVARAAAFLAHAQAEAEAAGYTVQTTRLSTRPLFEDMPAATDAELAEYAARLQALLDAHGVGFCSLGPAPASDPAFPLERLRAIPGILAQHPALNISAQVATPDHGVNFAALVPTAEVMRALAAVEDGMANFRFAALAMCEPYGPFFPQSYHRGEEWTVAVGLQSAGLLRAAIARAGEQAGQGLPLLARVPAIVREALTAQATPVVQLVEKLAAEASYRFAGIDLSPAPMGQESIVGAFEAVGLGEFGETGTLAVAAALTRGIQSVELPKVGYCGLMLPVLEDGALGERCADGVTAIADLLAYSAVCGTGLDTVPIPGDTPAEAVAALLADVASLAARLRKPLAARLFLVPGGAPGDRTTFQSPYITNSSVMPIM